MRWLSENPAQLAGLTGRKGCLARGYDADLVVFDPEAAFTVEAPALYHRHPVSPYHGRSLHGVVERTYLGGVEAWRRPAVIAAGRGQALLRPLPGV